MPDFFTYQSPIGLIVTELNDNSISRMTFSEKIQETDLIDQSLKNEVRAQLEAYFNGKLFQFDLPLTPSGSNFQKDVWKNLQAIEYGQQLTYSELAIKLGDKNLVRAVGGANSRNPIAIVVPCHRVVGANNKLVGYAGGIWRKKWLLQHELNHRPVSNTLF
ncbi:MAG TPA: methylated-DNA--[protein]-cysteine S-methyltransferase [Sunxiuqinia sp.]|nr:methylated-DNA--[protein]-cysteine S-methyltransferase [Sunxiuqinia sp.]